MASGEIKYNETTSTVNNRILRERRGEEGAVILIILKVLFANQLYNRNNM